MMKKEPNIKFDLICGIENKQEWLLQIKLHFLS